MECAPSQNMITPDEGQLLAALRRGDELAFAMLVTQYQAPLLRLALMYVPSRAVAEDVVQETWLAVLRGLASFEGRSSLKTWIFRILTNRAKTRGQREGRSVPFADLGGAPEDAGEPTVDPARFFPPGHEAAGGWVSHPASWEAIPEERLLAQETKAQIEAAIAQLPANQRAVISLRDVAGLSNEAVAEALQLSPANQRVLLHRARARVRQVLEAYLADG